MHIPTHNKGINADRQRRQVMPIVRLTLCISRSNKLEVLRGIKMEPIVGGILVGLIVRFFGGGVIDKLWKAIERSDYYKERKVTNELVN